LLFAIDFSGQQSRFFGERINFHVIQKLANESLPANSYLFSLRPVDAMHQFRETNRRKNGFLIPRDRGNSPKKLSDVLAASFGGNGSAGIQD
jgi:hypothetical protein